MKITYPENSSEIINEIVEKYGFSKIEEEMMEIFSKGNSSQTGEEILKNLPGYKLAEFVIKRAKGLSPEDLISSIKNGLETTNEISRQIAKEIEEKIIPFIEFENTPINELLIKSQEIKLNENIEEIKKSNSDDAYRENVEETKI
jgi:hypothetical protein